MKYLSTFKKSNRSVLNVLIVMITLTYVSIPLSAFSLFQNKYPSHDISIRGDYRPIPWGYELPFPWEDISGLWRARHGDDGDFFTYFEFFVVRESGSGERQLYVRQVDMKTCQVIAKGVGREYNKVVDIFMSTVRGGAYNLRIRSFSSQDYPIRPDEGMINNGRVVLMSASPLESPRVVSHFQLGRALPDRHTKICN